MKQTVTAAARGVATGIVLGGWLAFREMGTVIVGTVEQYRAQTNVDARAQARPARRQRPSGRDPVDPQTESSARCLCGQRVAKGDGRVPCPVHGPSAFDAVAVAAV